MGEETAGREALSSLMLPILLDPSACREAVRIALREDLGSGDITTAAVVSQDAMGQGLVLAREPLVVCGLSVMEEVFRQVDSELCFTSSLADGTSSAGGAAILARVEGRLASILTAERVALNFAQRVNRLFGDYLDVY